MSFKGNKQNLYIQQFFSYLRPETCSVRPVYNIITLYIYITSKLIRSPP